jgi:hypothetical protein
MSIRNRIHHDSNHGFQPSPHTRVA